MQFPPFLYGLLLLFTNTAFILPQYDLQVTDYPYKVAIVKNTISVAHSSISRTYDNFIKGVVFNKDLSDNIIAMCNTMVT